MVIYSSPHSNYVVSYSFNKHLFVLLNLRDIKSSLTQVAPCLKMLMVYREVCMPTHGLSTIIIIVGGTVEEWLTRWEGASKSQGTVGWAWIWRVSGREIHGDKRRRIHSRQRREHGWRPRSRKMPWAFWELPVDPVDERQEVHRGTWRNGAGERWTGRAAPSILSLELILLYKPLEYCQQEPLTWCLLLFYKENCFYCVGPYFPEMGMLVWQRSVKLQKQWSKIFGTIMELDNWGLG